MSSKCAFKLLIILGQFFSIYPKAWDPTHLHFKNILNTQNDHNTDWSCVVYDQATDWLSEECGNY